MKLPIPAGGTLLAWGGIVAAAIGEAFSTQIQTQVAAHPGVASVIGLIVGSIAAHGHSPTQAPPRG